MTRHQGLVSQDMQDTGAPSQRRADLLEARGWERPPAAT
jgi:hypothetical protein